MTTAASRPVLIEAEAIEDYPIGRDERLDQHGFVKWHFHRWLSSRTFRLSSWEVQGMARALFDMSQTESPVGTLPDDDAELAVMLRCDARRVRALRQDEFGPFRGWRPCRSDGERRLMHPVVLEQVRDALERRDARSLSGEAKAEYQRLRRLREALAKLGMEARVLADDVLVNRMDLWLRENRKGRRDRAAYEAVILHAQRDRWFGRGQ